MRGNKLPPWRGVWPLRLDVSRNHHRVRFLTELEQEGIDLSNPWKRNVVNIEASRLNVVFSTPVEFSQMIDNSGYKATINFLEARREKASQLIASSLHIKEGDDVFVIETLFCADDHPAIYCIDRFSAKLLPDDFREDKLNTPIFDLLKHTANINIVRDIAELSTTTNVQKPELIQIFKTQEIKSYLVSHEIDFDVFNTPILYTYTYFDTDFVRFQQPRHKIFADL